MGRKIVYMTNIIENGIIVPLGNPFLLTYEGIIKELKANRKRIKMKLLKILLTILILLVAMGLLTSFSE